MRGTRLWVVVGLIVTALIAAGCGGDDDDDDGGTTQTTSASGDFETIEEGVLTVGTDAPYPPFLIGTPEDPNFTGYEIELFNAIAEKIGYPDPQYSNTNFAAVFRDTANGLFDIAVVSSTILAERERVVDFTDPHYEAQQALLVPEDSDIASVDDLDGAIVGAQDGTTGEAYANDETGASEVRGFPQGPDAITAVVTGQVDATIIDQPVAVDAVEKQGGMEVVEEIQTNELYGFPVAPDNDGLREAVNTALQELKDDGTVEELYEKYFSTAPPESVASGDPNPLLTNN
jgi:polar amino acid transport system substrate-binding protein